MSLFSDSIALYGREMMIFRANLGVNLVRAALFPIIIILLFGNLGNTISNVPIVVVNYANNVQSLQFINALQTQQNIIVHTVTDQSTAMAELANGDESFVVVILPNFPSAAGEPSVQVYYTNTQFTTTSFVLPLIEQRAAEFTAQSNYQTAFYQPATSSAQEVLATPVNGASGSYKDFLFSGIIGMVVVFSAMFAGGISIITDRQGGNIKMFLVTPINKSAILIGRMLSGAVQSIVYVALAIAVGLLNGSHIAMGIPGLFWIFAMGMILMVGFTSMSAIIASRMKNIQTYAIVSQAISLPLWLLSGGVFPISNLPSWLMPISIINPITYATNGFRFVILQGVYPLSSIVTDFTVLIIFTTVMTLISLRLFKNTIE